LAIWTRQFQALRDGDRFFYGNDPALDVIAEVYGIEFQVTLAELIVANTDIDRNELPESAFLLDDELSISDGGIDGRNVSGDEIAADDDGRDDKNPVEVAAAADDDGDDDGDDDRRRRADRRRDREPVRDRYRPRRPRREG
jgi:hypothetical protein